VTAFEDGDVDDMVALACQGEADADTSGATRRPVSY
jgi:hypothetical protein